MKNAKREYLRKLDPTNPKQFWKIAKYFTKQRESVPTLKDKNGDLIHDNTRKAILLNDFFVQCFNTSVPPLASGNSPDPSLCPSDLLCDEEEVFDLLLFLDANKASGPDGVSAIMLKATATSIAPAITKLFNKTIQLGQIPNVWKISSIVPIPKGNASSQCIQLSTYFSSANP